MEDFDRILAGYRPIHLEEMDRVELMNRTDTKFLLSRSLVAELLAVMKDDYRVLEVNGIRLGQYETLYYDTSDFLFYKRHHAGKKNRYKVRKRSYVDSHLNFLEVKFKSNKDRTVKDRTRLSGLEENLDELQNQFITRTSEHEFDLEPKLWNRFRRITLVNEALPERLTIDLDLGFRVLDKEVSLPNVVIAEVKQAKQNRHSPFMKELKRRLIRPENFSKYCLGAVLLYPDLKSNNFKEKILRLKKLEHGFAA